MPTRNWEDWQRQESDRAQATAAVAQAQARLDATERAAASAQLETSRADDDAQRVHAELDCA